MGSKTLSSVIEKLIHGLGLNSFPCGLGSWRVSRDKPRGANTLSNDELLDLLNSPRSPWWQNPEWSPQASTLRQLAVLTPERLNPNFIYTFFTTLHVIDKGVTVVDEGLLKFTKLEELVLSANRIVEVCGENLPRTLKSLDLRANHLTSLKGLVSRVPLHLQSLSLASNDLGSNEHAFQLTGNYWPKLMCLDLSDCEFPDLLVLMSALSTLPSLKTLLLEGNPLTLAPGYPGFVVDCLPKLLCLDAVKVSPEQKEDFSGLAKMRDMIVPAAAATVIIGSLRGIPEPALEPDEKLSEYAFVTFRYFVTYKFIGYATPPETKNEPESKTVSIEMPTPSGLENLEEVPEENKVEEPKTEPTIVDETMRSTQKLSWSDSMDFADKQSFQIGSLSEFKNFLNEGFFISVEEEKILSYPVAPKDSTPLTKSAKTVREKKSMKQPKQPSVKSAGKEKLKGGKKNFPEMIEDTPIRRILGSAHVPLQNMIKGNRKHKVICEFTSQAPEFQVQAQRSNEKDGEKKVKHERKKEDVKQGDSGSPGPKPSAGSRANKKESEPKDVEDAPSPFFVDLLVEVERWHSTSEAHLLVIPPSPP